MNGNPHLQQHHHNGPRLDDLGIVSPIQTAFPSYQTPYPDSTGSSAPSEDPIIIGADEDKRKRNQAASARFRQKKKQREQQMAEISREAQEKTKRLEDEVQNLRRENTFLKKLLVEKVDNMNEEDHKLLLKTAGVTVNVKK
jgi:hypothetical protein